MTLQEILNKAMGVWYKKDQVIICPEEQCKERGEYKECYSKELNYCPIEQRIYFLSDN